MFLLNRDWKWELQQLRMGLKLTIVFILNNLHIIFTISWFIVGSKKWCSSQSPKWHLQNCFSFNQQSKKETPRTLHLLSDMTKTSSKISTFKRLEKTNVCNTFAWEMTDTMNRSSKYLATNCLSVDDLISREPVPDFPVCWNRIKPPSLSIPLINDGVSSDGWTLPNSNVCCVYAAGNLQQGRN